MSSPKLPNLRYIEQERELINKVKFEDIEECRPILEGILRNLCEMGDYDIRSIRVRVLEMVLLISRAAVEGGADFNKVAQANDRFINNIVTLNSFEDVSSAALDALEEYIGIKPVRKPNGWEVIYRAKRFMTQNYHEPLTIDVIAKAVHISPHYLSHLFKEVEGKTVIEYLTTVRVEKAKILLRSGEYRINEISERLGYKEPGYFAKVFRRNEGRTPSQFRELG